jgi:hypothetical protein
VTAPHRSTPEHWATVEAYAQQVSSTDDCLLELRARVEALEAAQRLRVFTAEEVAPVVRPITPAPAGSLVERVAAAIADNDAPVDLWHDDARAAIREVAAALVEWHDSDQLIHTAWEAAKWLEREAER